MKPVLDTYSDRWLALAFMIVCIGNASAQISFGPNGAGPMTFDTLPPVSEWSTRSTVGGAGDITTQAQMDAQVQTNEASQINLPLVSVAGTQPVSSVSAMWSSQGHFLMTRVTANRFNLLMAALRNDSGVEQTALRLSYDFVASLPVTEQLPGYSVYFSLTGATNSWQMVAALSGTNGAWNPRAETLLVGSWPANSLLYLLWTDDNGSGTPDTLLQIDNLLLAPGAPTFASHPSDRSVAPGNNVAFTVFPNGAPPFFYQWMKDGTNIPGATGQSYTLVNAQDWDSGFYSVLVSNSFGAAVSSNAHLSVACASPVEFTLQPQDHFSLAGNPLTLNVSATGTAHITLQWFLNGVPILDATNETYFIPNAQPHHSGNYSAVASNCWGSRQSEIVRVGIADLPYTVIGLTNHVWKYEQSNVRFPGWEAPGFNDAAWPSGFGVLAFENNAAVTPLTNTVLSNFAPSDYITRYFRTIFVLTNEAPSISLVSSNLIDDGAVIYLNGTEAFRYNLPQGPIGHSTFAVAANPAGEGVFIVSNVPAGLWRQGTNTLAVELHQNSPGSTDMVFGMELIARPFVPTPLAATNGPTDLVAKEGDNAVFTAVISGNPVHYRWFKDGVLIFEANGASLVVSNVTLADAGLYVLQASNVFGIVYSRIATLTVTLDRAPPALAAADLIDATHILATFSENVEAGTAGNAANYLLTNTLGTNVTIFSALPTNQASVLLTVAPINGTDNFVLTEQNITDIGPAHNASPGSAAPVARQLRLIAFNDPWHFLDPYPPFDDPDPGQNWRDDRYDDSSWGIGAGAFSHSPDEPPVPVNTTLSATLAQSSYFRFPFPLTASPAGLTLKLHHAVDDGAIFYLNRQEVHRWNMPAGSATPQTPSAANVLRPIVISNVVVSGEALHVGQNVFAAELHQWTANDPDKFFAAELTARAESLLTGPLLLLGGPRDIVVNENAPVQFRVSSVAASDFQWQMNGTNLPGATNAVLSIASAPLSWDGAQFRCLCGHGTTSLLSTSATLRVIADATPPVLLSAVAATNNVIVVSFSEPLALATATNPSNYVLTNANGLAATFSGAVLENGTNVLLFLAGPVIGPQTLMVDNVTDAAAVANPVVAGSAVTLGAAYFMAIDSAWKYLLINTNETVHATFMAPGFDDSTWLGPSNALFYVEGADLPAPKNTPLSLLTPLGERINTYYFRQRFVAPVGGSNVMQLRHLIDDGLVLHLNGMEIYRFNMGPGGISASSQAASSVEATFQSPIDVPVNLLAGTNVFAASVHQNGSASADVVFGVEMAISIPSRVLSFSAVEERVNIVRFGEQFALGWNSPGYMLEGASELNGPWSPLGTTSPLFVSRTNSAAFFRLKK